MSEPTLEDYIEFLQSPDPDVRRNAAWWLGRQRDLRIVEPLIAALNDPDPDVRLRVVESLGNIRDASAVPPLLETLADEQPAVRAMAAASLGRQGDPGALTALVERLDDPEPGVRAAAAQALSLIPDQQAVAALAHTMLHDADPDTRYYASTALLEIGGPATVETLLAALQGAVTPGGQVYIAEILGSLFDKRAVEPLRLLAQSSDEGVRETAKWALQKLGAG